MPIQKTVGVLDALNERIKMAHEELQQLESHNFGYIAGRSFSITWTIICFVVSGLLILPGLVLFENSPSPMIAGSIFTIPGILFLIWGIKRVQRKRPDNTDTRRRTEELRVTIQRLEQEKRELLLSHESEIKQESAESELKECPMCAELVRKRAKICKHCRHIFE